MFHVRSHKLYTNIIQILYNIIQILYKKKTRGTQLYNIIQYLHTVIQNIYISFHRTIINELLTI